MQGYKVRRGQKAMMGTKEILDYLATMETKETLDYLEMMEIKEIQGYKVKLD